MDAIAQSDVLNKPITPDDVADPEALEAKRKKMLATAKKFANTASAMLDERKEVAHFVDNFLKREREVDESLEKSQATPEALGGQSPARIWLSDLEKNSIFCWFDLKNAFEKHFRGTYKRPATTSDLHACGLQRGGLLRHKLTCLVNANKLTLDDMITIASDHSAADDAASGDLAATTIPLHQQKKNRDNDNDAQKRKNPPDDQRSGGSGTIAMAFRRGSQGREGGRGARRAAKAGSVVMGSPLLRIQRSPNLRKEYGACMQVT
ncbi:hypothetical protein QYE76_048289 [Lolium multiflorum]|uniref:Uncharacterized protein n=1 Tax=Lolium multiflorum TaxID=4521 RepID=A0AAD8PI06_LOLMU|nr:hypothetical protein QYE76_048289 [Lolium multiflorum]